MVAAECGGSELDSAGLFTPPVQTRYSGSWGCRIMLTRYSQIQPLNPDLSLEALGFNLNELWGTGNFDWDAMMP